jgi:competence protein ComFC
MQSQDTTQAQKLSGLFALKNFLLDLVFPPVCLNCGRVDWRFCETCQKQLSEASILPHEIELSPLSGVLTTGKHAGILENAVQALKYHEALHLAPLLAQRMLIALKNQTWRFDMIIPTPLSSLRMKERGYNQAKEISQSLAEQLNIEHQAEALQKIRHTQSQVGLGRAERLENVKEAFSADSSLILGKTLLLVDDVRTTGSTLSECAQAALQAGAKAVYAITVTAASL